ncbi:MAG: acyl-ACP thioesterase domain-containing protein [Actinomycetota bacterium]
MRVEALACTLAVPADLPAATFAPRPSDARVVDRERRVRLGDVDIDAALRLDATARYLQDVATDDAADAALGDAYGWVVRRTMIAVHTPARLGERVELATFCSGTGRSWAERRTIISGNRGAHLDAVALWIRVDPTTGRPTGLGDDFMAIYGPAAADRRVSTRLQLDDPPAETERRPWPLRQTDLDPLGHVNNAAQWAALEEILDDRVGVADVEHRAPVEADSEIELRVARDTEQIRGWLVADGTVRTALRWYRRTQGE